MTRILPLSLAALLVAVACGATADPTPSGPAPAPSAPAPAPVATPIPTEAPPSFDPGDINRLRVPTSGWETDFSVSNVDLAEFIGGGPGKDGIPAIDEPKFESIGAAREWLADQSPVVSVVLGGEARAYPLAILMWHEIVNDTVGGVPAIVTFCPLCHTALVFERVIDGVLHDFGTTGNLRHSDLVMYDRQTETWWQQATGQAIVGRLTGTALTFVPAQIVSFGEFERAYPDGMVLATETGWRRDYGRNPYVGYDRAHDRPFLFEGRIDERLPPKALVVTIRLAEDTLALPWRELETIGAAEVTVGGRDLVVFWQPGTASSLDEMTVDLGRDIGSTGVFERQIDGRPLSFTRGPGRFDPFIDRETGSVWSVTGAAIEGPLLGAQLPRVVHGDYFWFAWAVFNPETRVWTAP